MLAVTPMTRKWWLRPVSRRTLLVFSEALIYLSHSTRFACSWPSADVLNTHPSIVTLTERFQTEKIARDEGLFLGARPFLDLRFPPTRLCKIRAEFDEKDGDGRINCSRATGGSCRMFSKARLSIV